MKHLLQVLVAIGLFQSIVMQEYEVSVQEVVGQQESTSNGGDDSSSDTPKFVSIECEASDSECLSEDDLQKYCRQFKGQIDGGRCYFSGDTKNTDWSQGWAKCKAKGGTMAQVHTSAEFAKFQSALISAGADVSGHYGQWIALRRDSSVNSGPYAMDLAKTYWYHSETKYDDKLTAGNTWISTHKGDCGLRANAFCMVTWSAGLRHIGGDNHCSRPDNGVACMRSTSAQTFMYVPNTCIDAPEIKNIKQQSVNDCARHCAKASNWCRSFNLFVDGTCRLYSWVLADRPTKTNVPKGLCKHYTYLS